MAACFSHNYIVIYSWLAIYFLRLFHALELETCLFDGFAHIVGRGGAGDNEGIGGGGSLAGGDAFHFADRLLTGGLAVVAMHAFDGINNRISSHFGVRVDFMLLEFAEQFHA